MRTYKHQYKLYLFTASVKSSGLVVATILTGPRRIDSAANVIRAGVILASDIAYRITEAFYIGAIGNW